MFNQLSFLTLSVLCRLFFDCGCCPGAGTTAWRSGPCWRSAERRSAPPPRSRASHPYCVPAAPSAVCTPAPPCRPCPVLTPLEPSEEIGNIQLSVVTFLCLHLTNSTQLIPEMDGGRQLKFLANIPGWLNDSTTRNNKYLLATRQCSAGACPTP